MVSDDAQESEPMIAFMKRILMKLSVYCCINVCPWVFPSVLLFIYLYKRGLSCLIQTSYPYQSNEIQLVVVKWSRCFITGLEILLMFSNDILQFDK